MSLPTYNKARIAGKTLGREDLAKAAAGYIDQYLEDATYKNVIKLCGQLRAVAVACGPDAYWDEKAMIGYHSAANDLSQRARDKATTDAYLFDTQGQASAEG